jgi:hypothetical protein
MNPITAIASRLPSRPSFDCSTSVYSPFGGVTYATDVSREAAINLHGAVTKIQRQRYTFVGVY